MPGDENKVSVVILAYNEEKNIERCINSILKQTQKPFEIIVVNDGSTDNTLEKLKSFGKKIRIINRKKNKGRSAGYRDGFYAAKGDIVAYIDGDSYAPSRWIEKFVNGFKKSCNKTACIGGQYFAWNTKYLIPRIENKYNILAFKLGLFKTPSGTNMAYDKEICLNTKVFDHLPEFKCDKYAMDLLSQKKFIIKTIPNNVFTKTPHNLKGYLSQKFRWGRGHPSAKLTNPKMTLKKIGIFSAPFLYLFMAYFYPVPALIAVFTFLLMTSTILSIKSTCITPIEAASILSLKSMGLYVHSIGYVYEVIRKRIIKNK